MRASSFNIVLPRTHAHTHTHPLKDWAKFTSGPSFDQKFSSAPLKTQHHWGRGGAAPPKEPCSETQTLRVAYVQPKKGPKEEMLGHWKFYVRRCVLHTAVFVRAVIGQIDEAADAALQQTFPEIRCEPLKAVAHS